MIASAKEGGTESKKEGCGSCMKAKRPIISITAMFVKGSRGEVKGEGAVRGEVDWVGAPVLGMNLEGSA